MQELLNKEDLSSQVSGTFSFLVYNAWLYWLIKVYLSSGSIANSKSQAKDKDGNFR